MRLSEHIRQCQETLAIDGDIDVLSPSRGLIECDECGQITKNEHFEEPTLRISTHPDGGMAKVVIIEQ